MNISILLLLIVKVVGIMKKNLSEVKKIINMIYKIGGKKIYLIVLFSSILSLLPVFSLLVSQRLLNLLELIDTSFNQLIIILFLYALITIISSIVTEISDFLTSNLQITLDYNVNYLIMEKSSKLSLEDFENSDVYDKLTRLENEVGYKPFQTFQALIAIFSATITFVSSSIILLLWKPWIFFILILIPIISIFYYIKIAQQNFEMKYERSEKQRKSWYLSYLLTHDFSFKEVKMYGLQHLFLTRFWKIKDLFRKQEVGINRKKMIYGFISGSIQDLFMLFVIAQAVLEAFMGKLLIGNVAAMIKALSLVQSNSQSIITNIYSLYDSNLYMEMLHEFLNLPEINENETEMKVSNITSIEFKHVSFSYDSKYMALNDVSFSIKCGELMAIVGKNGSGKSTLFKLICGLYHSYEGTILINGNDLKTLNMETYREEIAILFQDYLKYEFSLGENVYVGNTKENFPEQRANEILSMIKVDFLKGKESYLLDEQLGNWFDEGTQLSGGQWQKIAIARALYRKASVYLLDEPSASLDSISESNIFNSFFKFSNNKIAIFITHEVSTAKRSNKILVMNNGAIECVGNHDYLLVHSKVYRDLNRSNKEEKL